MRFRLLCAAISGLALALLFAQADAPLPALLSIATAYGSGTALLTFGVIAAHFLASRVISMRHGQTDANNFYKSYARTLPIADVLSGLAAITVTISCFTVYKTLVIGAEGYHYDASIIAWDRLIFSGHDAWQVTHGLLPSAKATKLIDFLYHPAFLPMLVGYVLCLGLQGRAQLRYTYITAYLASFVLIGMIGANILNSAGPVYDGALFGDGTTFAPLKAELAAQSQQTGPLFSQMAQSYLTTAYDARAPQLGTGISAMPSMHIVMAFLWVFAGWSLGKTAGVLTTLYAGVIWFASVHLGWHYFSDGLVGLALLFLIWPLMAWSLRPSVG